MKTYDVTVRATVTKTLRIEAEDEQEARDEAYREFTVAVDDNDENYQEDILEIVEVKP